MSLCLLLCCVVAALRARCCSGRLAELDGIIGIMVHAEVVVVMGGGWWVGIGGCVWGVVTRRLFVLKEWLLSLEVGD